MESMTSGTMAGHGSFRCEDCGYVLTLVSEDTLVDCPECGGATFVRASLFGDTRFTRRARARDPREGEERVREARLAIEEPGEYLAFEQDGQLKVLPLTREWTRVGRSLAADIRFDDPTVSRRHALIVRQADGVRVLDDRSLNGVFVNGERVVSQTLSDGDEIVIGRYRLRFVDREAMVAPPTAGALQAE